MYAKKIKCSLYAGNALPVHDVSPDITLVYEYSDDLSAG
jgi:hypothetical protein